MFVASGVRGALPPALDRRVSGMRTESGEIELWIQGSHFLHINLSEKIGSIHGQTTGPDT